MKIEMQHYSGVLPGIGPKDWIAGVNSPVVDKNRNPVMEWMTYSPEHEIQFITTGLTTYETAFCVPISAADCIETEMNFLLANGYVPTEYINRLKSLGFFKNGRINFSDRFIGILGEIGKTGGYLFKVARAITEYGLIPESMLPLEAKTYEEFVDKTKITDLMYEVGQEFKKMFTINYEWIDYSDNPIDRQVLKNALMFSPVQAVVRYADGDGILNPSGALNHAVMINGLRDEYIDVNDSYSREQKKYNIEHPRSFLQYSITINNINDMDKDKFFKDNDQKWVRNINTGAFGKVLRGKLYVADSKDRLLLMLVDEAHRKNGVSITEAEWALLPKSQF